MAPHIPEPLFMVYELMFAIITPALICGAFADRMRFPPMLLFMALWHLTVYCPLAHIQWHPQGFMSKHGVIDFGTRHTHTRTRARKRARTHTHTHTRIPTHRTPKESKHERRVLRKVAVHGSHGARIPRWRCTDLTVDSMAGKKEMPRHRK